MSLAVVVPAVRTSPPRTGTLPCKPARPAIIPRGIPSKPIRVVAVGSVASRHVPSARPLPPTALTATVPSPKATATPSVEPLPVLSQTPDSTTEATPSLTRDSLAVDAFGEASHRRGRRQQPAIGAPAQHGDGAPPPGCDNQLCVSDSRDMVISAGPVATRDHERVAGVARQATLGALVVYADWSEACTLFVPRALAALRAHPDLVDGVLAVHVDTESCLCAYYAVDAVPCIIFRARPRGPSWRWRGASRPIEIPHTRITGACSDRVLTARIDAAVAAFCLVVPPIAAADAPMTPHTMPQDDSNV
nr:hypothetical protein [Pandoravirus aubagnensis]